ncbi:MAG: PKD domain-containing protein [Bacteroidota bacterium]
MKTKIYILVLLCLAIMGIMNAQTDSTKIDVKLSDFNFYFWNAYADKLHLTVAERNEFMLSHQKNNLDFQQKLSQPAQTFRHGNHNNTLAGGCNNIDFENGSLSGWTSTSGFHPLYSANPSGCCLSIGGQQTIMTGAGLDPAGNFPVVAPGGSFSLRLGNIQTGGQADRIEQTFLVTQANANFTYRYAVVMEDPGHVLTQQPSFQVEMLDSLGGLIPCTYYNVAAGNNIPGFLNSPTLPNVVYKPWSSVVADLTSLIGQNITIRFTSFDCSLGGHFGYAYVDADCMAFMTGSNDTICVGAQKTYCAPNGFLSTTWNGPGMVNNTNQCVALSAPGVYTCQTVLVPGCPGPDFTYTLSNFPQPLVSFNPVSGNACSPQYTFNNTSTISIGSLNSYTWSSGLISSNLFNFNNNFVSAGTHTVGLSAISNQGCRNSVVQTLTVYPLPVANFSAAPVCAGTGILPLNTSSIALGSISFYSWNNGNGTVSNLLNPAFIYNVSGNYVITLTVTSNQNCAAIQSKTITIYPKPNASFNQLSLNNCSPQYTFSNTSGISSGIITGYNWNFGNNFSTLQNPVNNFAAQGNHTISLIVTSNNNCRDTAYKNLVIYPFPAVGFIAPATCLGNTLSIINTSSINPGSISSYTWNFGNGNGSALSSPAVNYTTSGSYLVSLSAMSNQSCITTVTNIVVIHPLPTASIGALNLCHGNNTNFSGNGSISGGAITSYAWNFGDGNTSTMPNPSHQYNNTGNYITSLMLTSNQNCSRTYSSTVTINPLPLVAFSTSNVCHGNNTQFTNGSSIASGSINSYTWTFGNNGSSPFIHPTVTYANSGNFIVTLTAKSNLNCQGTATNNLVIHPKPVISFSVSKVCFGDTTAFVNNNSISSGNIVLFTWTFGDGNTSNAVTPTHIYQSYGNKTIVLTANSNQNCSASFTSTVMINPLPVLSFSANNVCHGSGSNFVNSSSIPVGSISNWVWDYGNGQGISAMQSPTYQYPLAGVYTVSLTATSNKNCSNGATKTIKVFANPVVSFASKNVCLGTAVTFTNSSSIASPEQITAYNWALGNGSITGVVQPVVNYNAGGSYPVNLTATSANNCSSSFTSTVTIHSLPQVAFIPTSVCKEQATQFTNQSTVSNATIQKSRWDFENDGIWDDTLNFNPVKTYPDHGSYSCKLEVESNFQCKGSKLNNVAVHANPMADFSTRAVCLGDLTTFQNLSSSVDGAITSYQWDFNGDNVVDNIAKDASVTYTANGTYLVKLEVQTQFGCTSTKSKSGHINAMPVAAFTSKNNKGCPVLNVRFQNTSSISSGSIIASQWNFGDGPYVDESHNPVHGYEIGNYHVSLKVISDSGCIAVIKQPGFVNVYPSPVAGFVTYPDEIDENEPLVHVESNASNAAFTSYYINDGTKIIARQFDYSFKNLEQTKPMIVQIVKNEYGCADTTFQVLKVKPAFVIYIPNTFTPNGDGVNDDFQAKGVGIAKFNMQIFDRWGHILFETNDINDPWDGRARGSVNPIMQDVYVWKATVRDLFDNPHALEGHVSLLR